MIWIVLHIVLCIAFFGAKHIGLLKTKTVYEYVIVFVPVVGFLLMFVDLGHNSRFFKKREIGLENMKISDVRYQRIRVDDEEEAENVVPLEEAIVVNDAKIRRKLLVDVLGNNPDEQIDLLLKASMSDDTELTHYATTFMMEIQSGYEKRISEFEARFAEKKNSETAKNLARELKNYIDSKLIGGGILHIYRGKNADILEFLMENNPDNKVYMEDAINNYVEDDNLEKAREILARYKEKYSDIENRYFLEVFILHKENKGEEVKKLLGEIKEKNIYLSHEGKKWYQFWSDYKV